MISLLIENIINLLDYYHQNKIVQYFRDEKIEIVIDVGAHKGEYLKKIRKINPQKIYAFEPQKNIYEILKKNTKNYSEVTLFNEACDDINSYKILYVNSLSLTSSLIRPNQDSTWIKFKKLILQTNNLIQKKIKIKTSKLDSLLFKALKPDSKILLKIDVEGNEINVLKGAKKILLNRNVTFVQVENARNNIYESNNQETVHKFLINNGYNKVKSFLYPTLSFSDDIYLKNSR